MCNFYRVVLEWGGANHETNRAPNPPLLPWWCHDGQNILNKLLVCTRGFIFQDLGANVASFQDYGRFS